MEKQQTENLKKVLQVREMLKNGGRTGATCEEVGISQATFGYYSKKSDAELVAMINGTPLPTLPKVEFTTLKTEPKTRAPYGGRTKSAHYCVVFVPAAEIGNFLKERMNG